MVRVEGSIHLSGREQHLGQRVETDTCQQMAPVVVNRWKNEEIQQQETRSKKQAVARRPVRSVVVGVMSSQGNRGTGKQGNRSFHSLGGPSSVGMATSHQRV